MEDGLGIDKNNCEWEIKSARFERGSFKVGADLVLDSELALLFMRTLKVSLTYTGPCTRTIPGSRGSAYCWQLIRKRVFLAMSGYIADSNTNKVPWTPARDLPSILTDPLSSFLTFS